MEFQCILEIQFLKNLLQTKDSHIAWLNVQIVSEIKEGMGTNLLVPNQILCRTRRKQQI